MTHGRVLVIAALMVLAGSLSGYFSYTSQATSRARSACPPGFQPSHEPIASPYIRPLNPRIPSLIPVAICGPPARSAGSP